VKYSKRAERGERNRHPMAALLSSRKLTLNDKPRRHHAGSDSKQRDLDNSLRVMIAQVEEHLADGRQRERDKR
jgi:hypothetical protein